jgi:hypothetical protein
MEKEEKTKKILIGITGHKQSGKDTIAEYLMKKYQFQQYAFATPLKKMSKDAFHLTDEQLYGKEKEIKDLYWGYSPRYIMQIMGDLMRIDLTKYMPELKSDFFVKCFQHDYQIHQYPKLVVSDVRFVNEANSIKELKGMIIKVTRKAVDEKIDQHISEIEMGKIQNFNFVIENDGTLEELDQKVDKIMAVILCQ